MNIVLTFCIIAILCAILNSMGIWKHGLFAGFVITTSLLAIHYDYGNDYMAYFDWFESSLYTPIPTSFSDFLNISRDPGWDILNILFGRLFGASGFFIMVASLSVIEGLCYYKFIKTYVPAQWYWLAMALYVLDLRFFMLTFSMMRQSLVMALMLLCFMLIQQKRILAPLAIILTLSTIHNSVILCIPLLAILLVPYNNQKLMATILIIAWLFLLLVSTALEPILDQVASLTDAFARYMDVYSDETGKTFGMGYVLRLLPFSFMLYKLYHNQFHKEEIPLLLIWSLSIILTPFCTIIPLFTRLLFYFDLAGLAVIPTMYSSISLPLVRYGMILSSIVLATYTLYTAFYIPESVYYEPFLIFRNIFEFI